MDGPVYNTTQEGCVLKWMAVDDIAFKNKIILLFEWDTLEPLERTFLSLYLRLMRAYLLLKRNPPTMLAIVHPSCQM